LIRVEDEKMDSGEGILVFLCVGVIRIVEYVLRTNLYKEKVEKT
jgi:hypothetical protein